jgi:hypothetical protein
MKIAALLAKSSALSILLVMLMSSNVASASDARSLESQGLGHGAYGRMHVRVQKTFLKINVATLDIQFGPRTRDHFAAVAKGQQYSEQLAEQIARIAQSSDDALIRLRFERNIPYSRWIDDVRNTLKLSHKAGVVDERSYERAKAELPRLFSVVEARGFRKGDQLLWRVRPSSLRIVLLSSQNAVLLDHTADGTAPARMVLAGYFSPGIDCREALIRSLLEH